jgi:hypothetical protein
MSLTLDPRPSAGTRRDAAPGTGGRERPVAAPRRATGAVGAVGAGARRSTARRARPSGRAARLLALHPGGAGFFAVVALGLSVLGLLYLSQISHVARAGYALSALQEQQAKVERENDVLQYRIDGQRTLARAAELAAGEYKMRELNPHIVGTATAASPKPVAAKAGATPAPQVRFIPVPRPPTTVAVPEERPPTVGVFARVRDRLAGIGAARAAGR